MSEPSDSKVNRNKKDTRIRYLEDLARWNMYSLELLASLGELHRSASNERSPKNIFSIANQHLVNILKFETVAFYLVKEDDSEFALHYIEPQESNAFVLKEVNRRIEDGTFAWAVNQNRTVVMETDDEDKTFIMHVLATQKRVRGMFVGVLDKSLNPLENNLQLTLSIILQNTALALESVSLYNLFYEANALLENRVRERTTDLEDHLVLLQEEISSRKLAEESLWAAREEAELKMSSKYLLLTQASHELKRPIQSMMACARMIREERAGSGAVDGKRMDKLQPVELAGRKALELIDVIDDLIFNKTSSLKNQIEPLDLDRLLNEVQAAVVPLEQESEYNIEVKIAPDLDVVESDEKRIQQILINILDDTDFFDPETSVCIEVLPGGEPKGERVHFVITAEKLRIKENQLNQLIERVHSEGASPGGYRGPGYGIILSHKMCGLLEGELKLQKVKENGAKITVDIPRIGRPVRDEPDRHSIRGSSSPLGNTLRDNAISVKSKIPGEINSMEEDRTKLSKHKCILVLDSDTGNSRFISRILEDMGWRVHAGDSLNWARSMLEQIKPDLVITDAKFPGKTETQFISELRALDHLSSIPVLLFSPREFLGPERESLLAKVEGILQKGNCSREDLIAELERLISLAK